MKVKSAKIRYRRLDVSAWFETVGDVSGSQKFYAEYNMYAPDYELVPLVIQPIVNVKDPNGIIPDGRVNESLTDMKWFEIRNKERRQITADNTDYTIIASGVDKGQIKLHKNVPVQAPVTLEFNAEYLDVRTRELHRVVLSYMVKSTDATSASPSLYLDSPTTGIYDPIADDAVRTITASLFIGETDMTADKSKTRFFWYRQKESGERVPLAVGVDGDNLNAEVDEIDHNVLRINQEYIGKSETFVCVAAFRTDGIPEAPDTTDPVECTTLVRRLPKFEYELFMPESVAPDTKFVTPEAIVKIAGNVVKGARKSLFLPKWYVKLSGEQIYTALSEKFPDTGDDVFKPVIPFTEGMNIGLEVIDRGPMVVLYDPADNRVLTTPEDTLIFDRKY